MNIITMVDIMPTIVSYISDIKTLISLKHVNKITFYVKYELNFNCNQTFHNMYTKYLFIISKPKRLFHPDKVIGLYVNKYSYISRIPKFTNLKYLSIYNLGSTFYNIDILPTTLEYLSTDCIVLNEFNKYFNNLKILKLLYFQYDNRISIQKSEENHFPQLTELYIQDIEIENVDVIKYTTLEILHVDSKEAVVTYELLKFLTRLKILIIKLDSTTYFIEDDIISDDDLKYFSNLTEVCIHNVDNNNIMKYMYNVERLFINDFAKYTNERFMNLINLKELYTASIEKNENNDNTMFNYLINLETLVCYDTIFGENYDIDIMFSKLVNLKTLLLFNNTISDKALINATKLEKLYCRLNTFTDKVFEYIPNLTYLHLGNNEFITGDTFHLIPKLKRLNLSNAKNIIIERLQVFSNLTFLNVGNYNQFMDKHLQYFPNLTHLNLNKGGRYITDEGLKYVPKLILLNLGYNKFITDEGIRYLQNLVYLYIEKNNNITIKSLEYVPSLIYIINDIYNKNISVSKIKKNSVLTNYRKNNICKTIINNSSLELFHTGMEYFKNVRYFNELTYDYEEFFNVFYITYRYIYCLYDIVCDDYNEYE